MREEILLALEFIAVVLISMVATAIVKVGPEAFLHSIGAAMHDFRMALTNG